ncbi:DNA polymerase III subunit chi [Paenalcaligenes faecalis]|uniref:DNA polymerase III subunit chi n=1 Tax=Paenalcaligenes faecalis TaxID=2980099 RepID=UPI0022B9C740|nr:DNA polymerase III subunit chi [Paenalcaligenes faecalis]
MSVRVDFAFGAPNRLRTTCDVVRKHYLAGRKLIIYQSDSRELLRLDRMLWGFEPTAYIPHVMVEDPLANQTPILLCQHADALTTPVYPEAWLINLDQQGPPLPSSFTRILEIVSNQESDKSFARQRWRHYQQHGYALHSHNLA